MFAPTDLPQTFVYFGPTRDAATLHAGEDFTARLEAEIRIHQGQIQAENLLLNTVAKYQHIAGAHGIPPAAFNQLLRDHHYQLDAAKAAMTEKYGIAEDAFTQTDGFVPVDTADYMRQRAAMIGAVLSSTPVLLRDPWEGKPVTAQYGFSDFKADVDGVGFSAVATPRHKGIPFRFAVMKHEHDGFTDNNPAIILSNEFCDAFALYNRERYSDMPAAENPLLVAMATNLKPSIHDRFHNWLLYDTQAASEAFRQWGDDIYFVEHADKNPLLINYEYVALCFHLYGHQVLFEKNPGLKERMYDRLEDCVAQVQNFGAFLKERDHPKAAEIEESTLYAVLSNICFVLNPFEERFQTILSPYPDIKRKLLEVREDGKGIGGTLSRLHGYEDGVPSQRYGGAREAAIEYVLRYPLVDEIREKLKRERGVSANEWAEEGRQSYTMGLESFNALPPALKDQLRNVPDAGALAKVGGALQALPKTLRPEFLARTEVSEEGYFFFRLHRDEIDYTRFEEREQVKKLLLVDVPDGQEVHFANEKKLSLENRVRKQDFHLVGGRDVLAVNVRDEEAAREILDHAQMDGDADPARVVAEARHVAAMTGEQSAGDLYKIEKDVARQLYGFSSSGFYSGAVRKYVARAPGPVVMQLHSGGDQRLVKGAFVYLPLGKDPAADADPDCHLIENTDFRRDYEDAQGTDALQPVRLKEGSPLMRHPEAERVLADFLQTLHEANFQVTHGPSSAAQFFQGVKNAPGLFS